MLLHEMTATEAIRRIRGGELSIRESIMALLARIASTDNDVRAWEYIDPERVLEVAAALDGRIARGESLDPLWGTPVGIKDVMNTREMPTCMGSSIWSGFRPGNDARVVDSIIQAGGIALGKTVTAEFAVHYNDKTRNPWNLEHSPGTSSSGSAAAVSLAQVPLALGTQTAASIMRPASFCGVYGFRPSFGLIPRTGILKTLDTLDHVGFLGRCVDDLELIFEPTRVKGLNYPVSHAILSNPVEQKPAFGPAWNIMAIKGPGYDNAPAFAREAFDGWVARCASTTGNRMQPSPLPEILEQVHELHSIVYHKSLSYYFQEEYKEHAGKMSGVFRAMMEEGRKISMEDYQLAMRRQNELEEELDGFFAAGVDVIVTPTTAGPAPMGLLTPELKDSGLIWTFCRAPSMSLPVFTSPEGLPFGIQIVTRRYRDYKLLAFARYLVNHELVPRVSAIPR